MVHFVKYAVSVVLVAHVCYNVSLQHGCWRRQSIHRARMMVLVPSPHTLDGPVKLKLKLGTATVLCPSLKGRTVSHREGNMEISLGREA